MMESLLFAAFCILTYPFRVGSSFLGSQCRIWAGRGIKLNIGFKGRMGLKITVQCHVHVMLDGNSASWMGSNFGISQQCSAVFFCHDVSLAFGWLKSILSYRLWMGFGFKRCKHCVAGTDFDLWTVNQTWSPVPCEKSICDTHKTQYERATSAGSVYRLWLYLLCLYLSYPQGEMILQSHWCSQQSSRKVSACKKPYNLYFNYLKEITMHLLLDWE